MKKTIFICSLFLIFLSINSCSNKKSIDGKWDDIIQLSTKKVNFDAKANDVTITTKGEWWWITEVTVNNEYFGVPQNINLEADSYIFQENCFTVERVDKHTLHIAIDENLTNAERKIVIGLEAGDYFDWVTIIQAAP
jgi:hypothetical protein